jgi:succinoglycan biosynthesis protein ExoV
LRLDYYPRPNFGDKPLNLLWLQWLPIQMRQDSQTLLVEIRSLLNQHLPRLPLKVIFSSGGGYGRARPDASCRVLCLRGPVSTRLLGLATEKAVTDGAVLVRTLSLTALPKTQRIACLPHRRSDHHGDWKRIW